LAGRGMLGEQHPHPPFAGKGGEEGGHVTLSVLLFNLYLI